MILEDLIERVKTVASTIGAANPRLLDSELIAQLLLPRVFDKVVQNYAKDANGFLEFAQDHSIILADGVGALPDGVKTEYLDAMYMPDKPYASFVPRYEDFVSDTTQLVDTFTVRNRQFFFRSSDGNAGDSEETVTINAITIPSLPFGASSAVDIKASILEQIISYAAAVIVGNIPLAELGLEYIAADGG